jgi:hypothetical protein
MIKFIVSNRLFKENDFQMFYKQLINKNKTLYSEEEIKEIYDIVREELDN